MTPQYILIETAVFQYRQKHNDYLKVSPYTQEDRRLPVENLSNIEYIPLEKITARQLLNKQWDNYTDKWTYNNKEYITGKPFSHYEYGECISDKLQQTETIKYYWDSMYMKTPKVNTLPAYLGYYRGKLYNVHWNPTRYGQCCHLYNRDKIAKNILEYKVVQAKHIKTVWQNMI